MSHAQAWLTARERKDFALFAPVLEEWVALTKEACTLINPDLPIYDVRPRGPRACSQAESAHAQHALQLLPWLRQGPGQGCPCRASFERGSQLSRAAVLRTALQRCTCWSARCCSQLPYSKPNKLGRRRWRWTSTRRASRRRAWTRCSRRRARYPTLYPRELPLRAGPTRPAQTRLVGRASLFGAHAHTLSAALLPPVARA